MNTNSGAAAAAASGRKRPRTEGAAAGGGAVSPTSIVDVLAGRIRSMGVDDPLVVPTTSLRDVLKKIEGLEAKNEGLEALSNPTQFQKAQYNANNTTLHDLRQEAKEHRAEIKDLEQQARGGGGAGAAVGGAPPQVYQLLPRQQDKWDEKTNLVEVSDLSAAGLSGPDSMLLYMRKEAIDLFNGLEKLNTRGALVTGPPGTGKSSVAWLWACHQARSRSVLWIHFGRSAEISVVEMASSGRNAYVHSFGEGFTVGSAIWRFSGSIVVLDGVTEDLKKDKGVLAPAQIWCKKQAGRRMIAVSSMQLRFGAEDLQVGNYTELRIGSWSLEQYEAACRQPPFLAHVRRNLPVFDDEHGPDMSIMDKYHVAGGSVRWMFGLSFDDAVKDANRWIGKEDDMQKLLAGLRGSESTPAVNHLVQVSSDGKCSLVSEFVSRVVAENCEFSFIQEAQRHAPSNGAFQGWVYEMSFLCRLRLCEDNNEPMLIAREAWPVGKRVRIKDVGELKGDLMDTVPEQFENVKGISMDDWIVPERFNQGGYDVAHVSAADDPPRDRRVMLRAVQLTRGERHSLKWQYVRILIDALRSIGFQVVSVDFVFVLPVDKVGSFAVGLVEGVPREAGRTQSGAGWDAPTGFDNHRTAAWDREENSSTRNIR